MAMLVSHRFCYATHYD